MTPAELAVAAQAVARHAWANRDRAGQFAGDAARWAAGGFAKAAPEVVAAREAACVACRIPGAGGAEISGWDESAAGGIGACHVCRCLAFKRSLATAVCPLGKWPA